MKKNGISELLAENNSKVNPQKRKSVQETSKNTKKQKILKKKAENAEQLQKFEKVDTFLSLYDIFKLLT